MNFRVPEAATGDNYVAEMPISFTLGSPAGEELRAALSTASARTPGRVPCNKDDIKCDGDKLEQGNYHDNSNKSPKKGHAPSIVGAVIRN